MITLTARKDWQHWTARLNAISSHPGSNQSNAEGLNERQDTVGAVAMDAEGGTAAGVSRYVKTVGKLMQPKN